MTGPLTILQRRLGRSGQSEADAESADDRPETVLHECPGCGTVFIQHSGDRCSECGTEGLEEQ